MGFWDSLFGGKSKDITGGVQSFNRFNQDITIHVKTYESKKDMQRARADHDGSKLSDHKKLLAYTVFANNDEKFIAVIHLPKDASEKTLGHEFLHCLKGTFHKE